MFVDFSEISFLPSRAGVVGAVALLSQAISNVPATVTLMGRAQDWRRLLLGVNVGGPGLVSGSLENLISVRLGGARARDLHRYSVPDFVASLIVCLAIC
ncbi:MAG: hypothetical protein DRO01_05475 [Thermoproteota archaeon]|nr:MAG: hypothetical protein DRO01_05475 [Candidatus Korarchaeota archaeon]